MKLFENEFNSSQNLLPKDGTVNYFGKIFNEEESDFYFENLMKNITWKNDEVLIFGKLITTKRKVAWYGDKNLQYKYSGKIKIAEIWTKELLALKEIVEEKSGEKFNSCLLNLYHDGSEGMSYHADNEKDLKKHGAIASVSFGAERKFSFKHKDTKEKIELILENGSLLVMKDEIQDFWLHSLPKSAKISEPRINITFRTIV